MGSDPVDSVAVTIKMGLHSPLGYKTLTAWNLPEEIRKTALLHDQEVDEASDPLFICVQAANLVTIKFGLHLHPDPDLERFSEPAIELLGVPDIEMATLMVDLEMSCRR